MSTAHNNKHLVASHITPESPVTTDPPAQCGMFVVPADQLQFFHAVQFSRCIALEMTKFN